MSTREPAVGLVCIDVDGTLVGASGEVHPDVWSAVPRARRAGVRLALCSGRPAFGITRAYAARLDADGWHCFQNGASVLQLAGSGARSVPLPRETVAVLVERALRTGRLLELYTDDDYAFQGPPGRARAHAGLLGLPFHDRPFRALRGTVVRAQWLVPPAETQAVLAEPLPGTEVSLSTSPVMPDTSFVNITAKGTDKSTAVRVIAAEYGLPLARVMFVGDSDNDLTAMAAVGWPVAVANAHPPVRVLARTVVPAVDAGGVAAALALALAGG